VSDSSSTADQKPKIDTSVPHSARIWNYWLGGKDNYPVDRMAGDQVMQMFPDMTRIARLQRSFLNRAIHYLVGEAGVRQFLDIGTGLPTANNTHQVAQSLAPESRIVYVDNDPLVLVHARALLTSTPEGACDYLDADVREPGKILSEAARMLDFGQPVALMMLGILGQIPDTDHPGEIIKRLMDPMTPGSYLAISDGVNTSETLNEASRQLNQSAHNAYHLRTPEQIAGFFDGLELVEPGVVSLTAWRPEATPFPEAADVPGRCGVGRKP
jgi:S-adenosyl methyltransferase